MSQWNGTRATAMRLRMAPLVDSGHAVCGICGLPIQPGAAWDIDHIVPIMVDSGQVFVADNLRPTHRRCNRSRGATLTLRKRRARGDLPQPTTDRNRQRGGDALSPVTERDVFREAGAPQVLLPPSLSLGTESYVNLRSRTVTDWPGWLPRPPAGQALPRVMTAPHPLATGSYGPELLEWARPRFGMHPKRTEGHRYWQELVLCAALQHDAAGELCYRTVLLGTARQCGKSWALRELCMWRIEQARRFGEMQTVIHAAAKLFQAEAIWKPAAMWAARQPKPSRRVAVSHPSLWDPEDTPAGGPTFGPYEVRRANGSAGLYLQDGSGWIPQAANDQLGVSQSVGLAIVDEAWDVPRWVVDSGLAPTQAEAASPQLWLISTAGRPRTGEVSDLYPTYRAQAVAQLDTPESTLIVEWSAHPDDDPGSVEAWRAASPHWDKRRAELLAGEWDKARGSAAALAAFRLNWLNQWPNESADNAWLPRAMTDACNAETGAPPRHAVAAVETALSDRRSHAMALAWPGPDGRIHAAVTLCDGLLPCLDLAGTRQLWAHSATAETIGPNRWGLRTVTAAQHRAATATLRDVVMAGGLAVSGMPAGQWSAVVIADTEDGQHIAGRHSGGDVHAVKALAWAVWAVQSGRNHSGFLFGAEHGRDAAQTPQHSTGKGL